MIQTESEFPWVQATPIEYLNPWSIPWKLATPVQRLPVPARFWRRGLAMGIDLLIALPVLLGGQFAIMAIQELMVEGGEFDGGVIFYATQGSLYLFSMMMLVLFTCTGGTPGHRVLGLSIVGPDGNPPGISRAIRRNVLILTCLTTAFVVGSTLQAMLGITGPVIDHMTSIVWLVATALWILSCLASLLLPASQTLHDKLAGTYVIRI